MTFFGCRNQINALAHKSLAELSRQVILSISGGTNLLHSLWSYKQNTRKTGTFTLRPKHDHDVSPSKLIPLTLLQFGISQLRNGNKQQRWRITRLCWPDKSAAKPKCRCSKSIDTIARRIWATRRCKIKPHSRATKSTSTAR